MRPRFSHSLLKKVSLERSSSARGSRFHCQSSATRHRTRKASSEKLVVLSACADSVMRPLVRSIPTQSGGRPTVPWRSSTPHVERSRTAYEVVLRFSQSWALSTEAKTVYAAGEKYDGLMVGRSSSCAQLPATR